VQQNSTSGHDVCHTANAHGVPGPTRALSASPSTSPSATAADSGGTKAKKVAVLITPALLTDREGAALLNIGLRGFLALQNEDWFPAPVILSARAKRHVASELLAAVVNRPRPKRAIEPSQLVAGKASAKCSQVPA